MKLTLLILLLFSYSAWASEILVTSEDCNFEVRKERDATVLRVNKIIAVTNSLSHWEIDLPSDKIKIPLEDNLKKTFRDSSGDETTVTFSNGILVHNQRASSTFTRDHMELSISPDLKHIRHAKFSRKGTGILSLFGSEKFECKF